MLLRHKSVLGTLTGFRRSFRKYKAMIAAGIPKSTAHCAGLSCVGNSMGKRMKQVLNSRTAFER